MGLHLEHPNYLADCPCFQLVLLLPVVVQAFQVQHACEFAWTVAGSGIWWPRILHFAASLFGKHLGGSSARIGLCVLCVDVVRTFLEDLDRSVWIFASRCGQAVEGSTDDFQRTS